MSLTWISRGSRVRVWLRGPNLDRFVLGVYTDLNAAGGYYDEDNAVSVEIGVGVVILGMTVTTKVMHRLRSRTYRLHVWRDSQLCALGWHQFDKPSPMSMPTLRCLRWGTCRETRPNPLYDPNELPF